MTRQLRDDRLVDAAIFLLSAAPVFWDIELVDVPVRFWMWFLTIPGERPCPPPGRSGRREVNGQPERRALAPRWHVDSFNVVHRGHAALTR